MKVVPVVLILFCTIVVMKTADGRSLPTTVINMMKFLHADTTATTTQKKTDINRTPLLQQQQHKPQQQLDVDANLVSTSSTINHHHNKNKNDARLIGLSTSPQTNDRENQPADRAPNTSLSTTVSVRADGGVVTAVNNDEGTEDMADHTPKVKANIRKSRSSGLHFPFRYSNQDNDADDGGGDYYRWGVRFSRLDYKHSNRRYGSDGSTDRDGVGGFGDDHGRDADSRYGSDDSRDLDGFYSGPNDDSEGRDSRYDSRDNDSYFDDDDSRDNDSYFDDDDSRNNDSYFNDDDSRDTDGRYSNDDSRVTDDLYGYDTSRDRDDH